jgi:hypothetical protein
MRHTMNFTVCNNLFDQQATRLAVLPEPFFWVDQVLALYGSREAVGEYCC